MTTTDLYKNGAGKNDATLESQSTMNRSHATNDINSLLSSYGDKDAEFGLFEAQPTLISALMPV